MPDTEILEIKPSGKPADIPVEYKTIVVYMPYTWSNISARVFRSFIEMTGPDIQDELRDNGYRLKIIISDIFPIDRNRNKAVTDALSSTYEADYILFIDGDNICPKRTIFDLLAYISIEFPVVSGLYFRKTFPHKAVPGHYSGWDKHELQKSVLKQNGYVNDFGQQILFYRAVQDFTTIQPVDVSGCGVLMVKADVFKKIDLPYFGYMNSYSLGGDFTVDNATEDMLFFAKLNKAGVKTLLVPAVRCGHVKEVVIGCPEEE